MNGNESQKPVQSQPQQVQIYIDDRALPSPNPTTGDALYRLGDIKSGFKLFRLKGDKEDQFIENGREVVHLKDDERFRSGEERGIMIVVSGTAHPWDKPKISYVEVVTLFDPGYPQHPEVTYSVKYSDGPSQNPEGIMAPASNPVKVKERMNFRVSPTGES